MFYTVLPPVVYSLSGNRNFAKKEELIYETIAVLTFGAGHLVQYYQVTFMAVLPSDIYGAKIPFP